MLNYYKRLNWKIHIAKTTSHENPFILWKWSTETLTEDYQQVASKKIGFVFDFEI